jgi:hypothetical protein
MTVLEPGFLGEVWDPVLGINYPMLLTYTLGEPLRWILSLVRIIQRAVQLEKWARPPQSRRGSS